MTNVENLKLKFLVKLKAGRVFVSVKDVSSKLVYIFVIKNSSADFSGVSNKTRLFFKRFRFIACVIDRLVKNGLIS